MPTSRIVDYDKPLHSTRGFKWNPKYLGGGWQET